MNVFTRSTVSVPYLQRLVDCITDQNYLPECQAIRIAPNELHLTDASLYKTIYSQTSKFHKYAPFYGAFGIPHLTFQLRVAACAPGVPYDVWRWALDTLEAVWAELGMLHAKSLAEVLRGQRDKLDRETAGGTKVKIERDVDGVGNLPVTV